MSNVLARINLGSTFTFELAETPKGFIQASIDGVVMTDAEAKELAKCLKAIGYADD